MDYRIDFVFQNLTDELKKEVTTFWLREGALTEGEAEKRIQQVSLIARNNDDQIIGVSTIFQQLYEPIGKVFFYFRGFVKMEYRREGIILDFLKISQKELNHRFNQGLDKGVIGILIKIQNPDLMKGLYQAVLPRTGFVYVGMEDNCHVRISYFENARID